MPRPASSALGLALLVLAAPVMKGGTARSPRLALRPPFDPHAVAGQSPATTSAYLPAQVRHTYASKVFNESREFVVVPPPDYDPARTYPLLVLLHGAMGRPLEWIDQVGVHALLAELVARGEAEPMVLVLPSSYGFPEAERHAARVFGATAAQQRRWMEALGRSLFEEVLPLVEGAYSVRRDPDGRALAGFSMGGAQALYLGLRHSQQVSWIGAFAPALVLFGDGLPEALPRPATQPRLLWMACGRGDFLLGPNRAGAAWLDIPLHESEGAHDAPACRAQLRAFLPRLFHP